MGWKRREVIGNCTLYLGDAREIVPMLGPVRLVVSDVPYALTSGGPAKSDGNHKVMSGGWMADYDNGGKVVECDISWPEIMALCFGALCDDGEAYIMANDKHVGPAYVAAMEAGFRTHNLLPWHKVSCTANRWYMKDCEFTWYLFKGRARAIANCSSKQLVRMPQKDVSDHPTEKPVLLMAHYITNSAREGEAVLDPFMGSGATGVACARAGLEFHGVEIVEGHFDTACRRVEATCRAAPGLFDGLVGAA